jgi:PIN domain nuclease of toxin-antitoxin system
VVWRSRVRLLLDTHVFIWRKADNPKLPSKIRNVISGAEDVFISVATAWEIAIKAGIGKLPKAADLIANFEVAVLEEGFTLQPITVAHVRLAGLMPSPHRDPFDRLLAAQASIEGLTLVSSDAKMTGLGAEVLW